MLASEVASDTGPLISLEKLPGGFALLRRLFARVLIPPEVLAELAEGHESKDYLRDHSLDATVVVTPERASLAGGVAQRLDAGERAAISLALARGCPLLIEERLGREVARAAGVPVVGAAGLVGAAHRQGLLPLAEAEQMLLDLRAAGRIGQRLLEEMLASLARGGE